MAYCLFPHKNHSREILSRGSHARKAEDGKISAHAENVSVAAACHTGSRARQDQPSERREGHTENWAPFLCAARRHQAVYLGAQHGQLDCRRSQERHHKG